MKLIILSTSNSRNAGGLFSIIINTGKALLKYKNIEPTVIAFNDNYSHIDTASYTPLKLDSYNIIGSPGLGFTLDLYKKIKKNTPDLIHVNGIWLLTSFINYWYCITNKVPYVITVHGMLSPWILNTRKWKKKIGLFLYERKHLKYAKCIHVNSVEEYMDIRNCGFSNPIAVIPNGVNLPHENVINKNVPQHWNSSNKKRVLFLSRLHPKKGLENLIYAWSQIGSFSNDWELIIAGESKSSDFLKYLKSLIKTLNLEDHIKLIGPQFHDDKDYCFRNVDAFILPSFSEGMPMAVLEAWSYKLPTLITEECNLPDGFENNAAVKIKPDVDSILEGLKYLFNLKESDFANIGNNAYNLVKDKYTWDAVGEKLNEVYSWVLDGGAIPVSVKID